MANTKISALTALDAFATGDLLPMVDDPSGTPATKKATVDQIATFVRGLANTWTGVQTFSGGITGASNVIAVANSTNAQSLFVYNTTDSATSPTNYERGFVRWNSNVFEIGTAAGGTGTVRNIAFTGGNVGIGTTSPAAIFEAQSSSAVMPRFRSISNYAGLQIYGTYGIIANVAGDFYIDNQAASGAVIFRAGSSSERIRVTSAGNIGIGTTSPTELLDVNSDAIRVRSSQTPASASATGDAGMICWDSSYVYVCTATNTWKRAALTTW